MSIPKSFTVVYFDLIILAPETLNSREVEIPESLTFHCIFNLVSPYVVIPW